MGDLESDLDTFRGAGTAKSDGGFRISESMTARGTAHRVGKGDGRDLDRGMKRIVVGMTVEFGKEGSACGDSMDTHMLSNAACLSSGPKLPH